MVIPMNHGDLLGKENLTSVEVSMFLENVNLGNNLLDEKKKKKLMEKASSYCQLFVLPSHFQTLVLYFIFSNEVFISA